MPTLAPHEPPSCATQASATPAASVETARLPGPSAHYQVVTHAELFRPDERACDACGAPLPESGDAVEEGRGLYVWARDGGLVFEEPPLCPACAAAITLSALQRWETEEDEG